MNQPIKNKSFIDILNDPTRRSKARDVYLKLLAKQKSKHKDWSGMRSHSYSASESLPGVSPDDII